MGLRALASILIVVPLVVPLVASVDDKQDFSKVAVKATKVAGQVYVVREAPYGEQGTIPRRARAVTTDVRCAGTSGSETDQESFQCGPACMS